MTRGFVTIATGAEHYYDIARNLLYSYRQSASHKYPFAIICDKKNSYTKEFDDVILLDKAYCNFLDKLQLYNYLPYDETIFIDADSLAYGDLDEWWKIFEDADDFSLFGYAWEDLKSGRGWFNPDGTKEFKDKVSYIPDFNGGIYYIRRSETAKKVFELANYFAEHFSEYAFNGFTTPADEPCLALAMAVCNCRPLDIWEKGLTFAPAKKDVDLDIAATPPKALCRRKGKWIRIYLVHWSNYRTKLALYKFEIRKLMAKIQGKTKGMAWKLLYQTGFLYYGLSIGNVSAYADRAMKKLRKQLRKKQ